MLVVMYVAEDVLPRMIAPTSQSRAFAAEASPVQESQVWVNTKSGVYHCPGTQYYGNTKSGTYLSESDAKAKGYRPAHNKQCGSTSVEKVEKPESRALSTAATSSVKVWVNSSSNVYHCPGSQYYGNTKRGRYMTESEAQATGNRPAYGRRCG
jgi:hypothetical protein